MFPPSQLRSLGAVVASGSHQVSLLELRLRRGEQELQGERQVRDTRDIRGIGDTPGTLGTHLGQGGAIWGQFGDIWGTFRVQALSQERLRAEAAEEELGRLGQALSRYWGNWDVSVNVPTPVPITVLLNVPADVPVAVPRLLGTLANVTAAIGALGSLSERLGQAQHRLQGQ